MKTAKSRKVTQLVSFLVYIKQVGHFYKDMSKLKIPFEIKPPLLRSSFSVLNFGSCPN